MAAPLDASIMGLISDPDIPAGYTQQLEEIYQRGGPAALNARLTDLRQEYVDVRKAREEAGSVMRNGQSDSSLDPNRQYAIAMAQAVMQKVNNTNITINGQEVNLGEYSRAINARAQNAEEAADRYNFTGIERDVYVNVSRATATGTNTEVLRYARGEISQQQLSANLETMDERNLQRYGVSGVDAERVRVALESERNQQADIEREMRYYHEAQPYQGPTAPSGINW